MKWIKRITEYYRDKFLAAKCGLEVKDICVHERDGIIYWDKDRFPRHKCAKCGEFYR